jgi:ribosomal protein L40E
LDQDMKTCPKCGAENKQTAPECRLCATPLESSEDLLVARVETGFEAEIPPTMIVAGDAPSRIVANSPPADDELICPNCHGSNDPDWLFCQQCGTKLKKPAPAPTENASAPVASIVDTRPAPELSEGSGQSIPEQPYQPVSSQGGDSQAGSGAPFKNKESGPLPPALPTSPERSTPVPDNVSKSGDPAQGPPPDRGYAPASPGRQADLVPDTGSPPPEARAVQPLPPRPSPSAQAPAQAEADEDQPRSKPLIFCCVNCGELLPAGATYCASCGVKVSASGASPKAKTTGAAIIEMITEGGLIGDTYSVSAGGIHIGRVEGEVTFPHDGYMSGRHAQVVERDGEYFLTDQNSRNGTFIRIRGEIQLKPGDTFLVGKQVFRFGRK